MKGRELEGKAADSLENESLRYPEKSVKFFQEPVPR
jgi:hypothetical protein